MSKVIPILAILALASCVGNRTSYLISSNAVNSAEACEILARNQKIQYKQAARKSRRNHKTLIVARPELGRQLVYSENVPLTTPDKIELMEMETTILLSPQVTEKRVDSPSILDIQREQLLSTANTGKVDPKAPVVKTKKNSIIQSVVRTFRESIQPILMIGLTSLAAMAFMRRNERKSMNLSRWGKNNPVLARGIIVGAQSVVTLSGLALGHSLYTEGIMIPEYSRWLPIGLLTTAAAFYPNKFTNSIPNFSYARRKMHDIGLIASGAMLMTYAGNHYDLTTHTPGLNNIAYSVSLPGHEQQSISLLTNNFSEKIDTPASEKTRGQKVADTVLISIIMGILMVVVAGLSCSISCNGNEALAALVLIGGEGLLTVGLVSAIRSIHGKTKKQKKEAAEKI